MEIKPNFANKLKGHICAMNFSLKPQNREIDTLANENETILPPNSNSEARVIDID